MMKTLDDPFTPPARAGMADHHKVQHAFEILHYNQSLIQFADNKANTLIVINSIALATVAGVSVAAFPHEARAFMSALKIAFLLASVASIILSLIVVVARADPAEERPRSDLVFFADILSRKGPEHFAYDYLDTRPALFLDDLLHRNFRVAVIAARKYRFYSLAQHATVLACLLWLLHILAGAVLGQGL